MCRYEGPRSQEFIHSMSGMICRSERAIECGVVKEPPSSLFAEAFAKWGGI